MHVNLSVAELGIPTWSTDSGAAASSRLPPDRLASRSPRPSCSATPADSAARFEELRELGVRIALDDFGTGYSSLSYLHSLPLDSLKIAKPFVDGLGGGGREAGFIAMILDLARTLELEVIAEGIETRSRCMPYGRAELS